MPLDRRALVVAFVMISVVLAAGAMRGALSAYEHGFVHRFGTYLRHHFVVADPRSLYLATALIAIGCACAGWCLLGPPGAAAAIGIAILAPRIVLNHMTRARTRKFVYQLPDALLALASTLRAGSSLSKGLELLSTRQPAPLGQEFTIVLNEHRVGRPLCDALADLRRRIDAPELDLMNTAINVSRRVGGNLADTLESLARTLQEKAHLEGKIAALTAMGRAQGWVVGVLPILITVVLYAQQPERMKLLFTQWYGWIVLAVVGLMMTVAAAMIRRIVNIDV